jgi:transcriptional regulator with XRE-family HTH domain
VYRVNTSWCSVPNLPLVYLRNHCAHTRLSEKRIMGGATDWFAGRLKELREKAGLSRRDLAKLAGMRSAAGIRNLEQGIRKPSWDTVIALCHAFNVGCDEFLQPPGSAPGAPAKAAASSRGKPAGRSKRSATSVAAKPSTRQRRPRKGKARGK